MEIFKKIIFISILLVGATLFISCNKKSNDISKEKENKQLETKDLSIYELIKNSIQANGELPENFILPPKDPNGVPWADGAMDGVYIYHTVGNEEDIEPLKNIVFQISEGKFEEAETNLDKLDFSMVSRTNSLLSWIIQEQKQINLNNLYEFASSRLVTTKNIEVIKFCLSVLAIMNVETDAETIEKVKILALSDEFTLYCLNIFVKLENSNKEIFEIAKKVKGWGRVHSIGYLEATNDEIKEWILEEGCHNYVLPAYTAYTCAKKINLIEMLNDGKISNKKFNDISYLMNALLDESAITGISALEDRELLIERYLEKAKTLSSTEEDYEVVRLIKEYVEDIWGCELIQAKDENGNFEISEIGYTIDNTSKTRAIFEINKGVNKNTGYDVNAKIKEGNRRVLFKNMIYIADGPSDVPAFSVIKKGGGSTFAIYPKLDLKAFKQVEKLREDNRVDMYAEADYSEGTTTYMWIMNKIQKLAQSIVDEEKSRLAASISDSPKHLN